MSDKPIQPESTPQRSVFVGLHILGKIFKGDAEAMACLLSGELDQDLLPALEYVHHMQTRNHLPINDAVIQSRLEDVKNHVRWVIKRVMYQDQKDEEYRQKHQRAKEHEALVKSLLETSKPHELGTVSELATKYGVSKSEIRRHKAAGTLEEFIASKAG